MHVNTLKEWRRRGAEEERWWAGQPHRKALVAYLDDPRVRERVLIALAGPRRETDQCWVLIPDDGLYVEGGLVWRRPVARSCWVVAGPGGGSDR